MSIFFKTYVFDSFDKENIWQQFLFTALGSLFWYVFVAVKGWDSIWFPFALTFLWIFIFKAIVKAVLKTEYFKYNLLLEICLYFIAVVAFRFLYEN